MFMAEMFEIYCSMGGTADEKTFMKNLKKVEEGLQGRDPSNLLEELKSTVPELNYFQGKMGERKLLPTGREPEYGFRFSVQNPKS